MSYDRDTLLRRTDLAALADELLGGHVGAGRSAKWPSPVPGHPQTGKSPPMSVFTGRGGQERWTCFATGQSGTAIDLVMLTTGRDVRDAIEWLAQRASVEATTGKQPERTVDVGSSSRGQRDAKWAMATRPSPRIEAYVATCERWLWRPAGASTLSWLTDERGFDPEVLRVNRVGFDPGTDGFRRPSGLPRRGPAAVFPVLGAHDRAIFYQARYLDPAHAARKYDNPPSWLAPNPKLAVVRNAADGPREPQMVVVTEGVPDGLSAASAGYPARAILGTSNAGAEVARQLAGEEAPLLIAFDADPAGRQAAARLQHELTAAGRLDRVGNWCPPAPCKDLNEWLHAWRAGQRPEHQVAWTLSGLGL